jgi:hypothetical protein
MSRSDLAFVKVPERADQVVCLFDLRKLPEEDLSAFRLCFCPLLLESEQEISTSSQEGLFPFLRFRTLLYPADLSSCFPLSSIPPFVPAHL